MHHKTSASARASNARRPFDLLNRRRRGRTRISDAARGRAVFTIEAVEQRMLLSGTPIQSGQMLAGAITAAGQKDSYTFSAAAGNTFEVSLGDASAASQVAPYLLVYGPDGTQVGIAGTLATNTSVSAIYHVPATGAGTYTIVAQDRTGNGTGAYDLKLVVAPATQAPDSDGDGGPIVSGQTLAGTINRTGDLDVYTFSAAAGNTFEVSLGDASAASQVAPYLLVYGPDGTQVGIAGTLATNTSVSAIYHVPATGAGTYTIVAQDRTGNGTGAYDLKLVVAPATQAPDSDGDGGPIVSGQTLAGTINRTGDLDVYTFSAAAGNTFEVSLGDASAVSQVAPYLLVYGPDGTQVGIAGTLATNTSVSAIYHVPATGAGTYTIVAQDRTGNGTGAYDLKLVVAPATQAPDSDGDGGPIVSGQTLAGTINRTGDLDVYTFSAAAGNTFEVSLGDASAASQVAPYLLVYGPDGTQVGIAGTLATNTSVSAIYHVPATGAGTYTIIAQDRTGKGTGAYDLKLVVAPATQAPDSDGDGGTIAGGQTKSGMVKHTGDLDVYTFPAAAGDMLNLSLADASAASQVAPYLLLYGPDGTQVGVAGTLGTNTSVNVLYTVPDNGAGTFTAIAQDRTGNGTGAYNLTLAVSVPPPTISFNDAATPNDITVQTQRSEVRSIVLRFSQPIQLKAGAVTLSLLNTGGSGINNGSPPTDVSSALSAASTTDGGLTWIVKFSTADTANVDSTGSLKDGIYTVAYSAVGATDSVGNALSGVNLSTTFHRLFGDIDGNGTVNSADYFKFKAAFGSATGQANFNSDFDFDGNGKINSSDYFKFKANFGKKFTT